MDLRDDFIHLSMRTARVLRDEAETARQWPALLAALKRLRDQLAAARPGPRPDPTITSAIAWLRATIIRSPVAEADCDAACEVLEAIEGLVGAEP